MNICPFMSSHIINSAITYVNDGSTQTPAGTDIADGDIIIAELHGTALLTGEGFLYHPCLEAKCQMWDSVNDRCGMQVSDTVKQSKDDLITHFNTEVIHTIDPIDNDTKTLKTYLQDILGETGDKAISSDSVLKLLATPSVKEYLEKMIGVEGERDGGKTLTTYLKDVLGETADNADSILKLLATPDILDYLKLLIGVEGERDAGKSLTAYLKDIAGVSSERDDGSSVIAYLQNMVGVKSERDGGKSLTEYVKNIFGINSEKDAGNSLSVYLQETLGKVSEKDSEHSLLLYLQNIFGINSEKDAGNSLSVYLQNMVGTDIEKDAAEGTGSSLVKSLNHVHGAHWHGANHGCGDIPVACGSWNFGSSAPYAAKLINEYMAYEDLDGNGLIYGRDFKVADSEDKPPMLFSVEDNPAWTNPPVEVSWAALKAWGNNPNAAPNPLSGVVPVIEVE